MTQAKQPASGAISASSMIAGFFADIVLGARLIVRNRRLLTLMAGRDLRARHMGQVAGNFWIIAHPLFQMLLFVFIFSVVFKQKIGGTHELPGDYTTYILSGLVPWLAIIPAISTCCLSIVGNSALVKQFTFDLELLPVKDALLSLVFWCVGITILAIYTLGVTRTLPITYLLLPAVLGMHLMLIIGLGWALAAITVFFRDLKDIVTVLIQAGVYLLPIVYLPTWVPAAFRPFIVVNPFSWVIWVYQDTLYFGRIDNPWAWLGFAVLSVALFSLGLRIFRRSKPLFGHVL